jgi:hypothetical protein
VKALFFTSALTLIASLAFAQPPAPAPASVIQPNDAAAFDDRLGTPTGHEVQASLGTYTYIEPGAQNISIDGAKIGGEYTGTIALSKRRHWFAETDAPGKIGKVTYTGWCSPFVIAPNRASPNGYEHAASVTARPYSAGVQRHSRVAFSTAGGAACTLWRPRTRGAPARLPCNIPAALSHRVGTSDVAPNGTSAPRQSSTRSPTIT